MTEKKNAFLKRVTYTSAGTLLANALNFFTVILIVQYTNGHVFGSYVFILTLVHGMRVLGGLGLDLTMVHFLSGEYVQNREESLGSILFLRLLSACLTILLFLLLGRYFLAWTGEGSMILLLIPLLFFLTSFKELSYYILQGLELFGAYAIMQGLFALTKCICTVFAVITLELNLEALLWLEIVILIITFVYILYFLPFGQINSLFLSQKMYRHALSFGFPLYLNNILTFIYSRIHIFIIAGLLHSAGIAFFEVANKIPESCSRMFHAFIAVYFPHLSGLYKADHHREAQDFINHSLVLIASCGMVAALIAFLFREQIMVLFFSADYLASAKSFAILMINFQIMAVSYTMGYTLVAAGYSTIPVKVNLISSAVSITANYFLVGRIGFEGATFALLLMNITAQIMNYAYLRKQRLLFSFWKHQIPIVLYFIFILPFYLNILEHWSLKVLAVLGYSLLLVLIYKELRRTLFFPFRRYVQAHQV